MPHVEPPRPPNTIEPFAQTIAKHGLSLKRDRTHTLQINAGLLCNQACAHCHLEAGPKRTEIVGQETMGQVLAYAQRVRYQVIDITGGAPELIPGIEDFLRRLRPLAPCLMLRSNLTALAERKSEEMIELLRSLRIVVVASLPAVNVGQVEAQRGKGAWEKSIAMLRQLNQAGYGQPETGLTLNLVANPAGAFLPAGQEQTERKFRADLLRKAGVLFSNLYTFANVPLGRYRRWLINSKNYPAYMERLAKNFNPATIPGLMCRSILSVAWNGQLYDCDFNQAAGLALGGSPKHITELEGLPPETAIATGDHCYACTAGAGFT